MSFNAIQLSVLAYANGFTHWHYRTGDSLAVILAPGYFAAAAEMFRPGDQITLNLLAAGNVGLAQCVVADISGDNRPRVALLAATPVSDDTARLRHAA